MSFWIPIYIHQVNQKEHRKSNQTRKVLSLKVFLVYLNSVVFSNFRPNWIKVSIDEFRQKAERVPSKSISKTTYLLTFKTVIIKTRGRTKILRRKKETESLKMNRCELPSLQFSGTGVGKLLAGVWSKLVNGWASKLANAQRRSNEDRLSKIAKQQIPL